VWGRSRDVDPGDETNPAGFVRGGPRRSPGSFGKSCAGRRVRSGSRRSGVGLGRKNEPGARTIGNQTPRSWYRVRSGSPPRRALGSFGERAAPAAGFVRGDPGGWLGSFGGRPRGGQETVRIGKERREPRSPHQYHHHRAPSSGRPGDSGGIVEVAPRSS